MSDAPAARGAVLSAAETAAFGFTVGRLDYGPGSDRSIDDVEADLAASDVDLVVLRYPAENVEVAQRVFASGRPSLMADTLMHFRWEPLVSGDTGGHRLTRLGPEDGPLLDKLVAEVFPGYRNHYSSNPMTSHLDVVAGYQEWARSFLAHPDRRAFAVLSPEGSDMGLCTVTAQGTHLETMLAGVRPGFRGRGAYQAVLQLQANWALDSGLTSMGVLTQAWNTSAMRPMIRAGLLPEYALSTLHVMR